MKNTKVKVMALFLLAAACAASAEKVYICEVSISKDDSVQLKDFNLTDGKANLAPTPAGEYSIKVFSESGQELFTAEVPVSFQTHEDVIDMDGKMRQVPVNLTKVDKFLRLPYSKDAIKINVYHKDAIIYSLNIPEKLCVRDGQCSDYCRDKNDPDCTQPVKPGSDWTLPGLLMALVVIGAAFLFLRKKRK